MIDNIYNSLQGLLTEESAVAWVEDAFVPGSYCERQYASAWAAYNRAPLKNSPFGLWANLLSHKCVMKKSQYIKYSVFSITFSETKSSAQILKKEFFEVANRLCARLGVDPDDEDEDLFCMIDALESIQKELCRKMFIYGEKYAHMK